MRMNSNLSPTQRDDSAIETQTTRRRWLSLCGVLGISGLAGCADTDDDETTDDTDVIDDDDDTDAIDDDDDTDAIDDDADDDPPWPAEPDSFAFEIEHRSLEEGEWTVSETTGYIAANGDFYSASEADDYEQWGIWEEEIIYFADFGGDCYYQEIEQFEPYPFELSTTDSWFLSILLAEDRRDSGTTTIDGHEVTFYEYTALRDVSDYPDDSGDELTNIATEYISTETGLPVGVDLVRLDDGEPTLERSVRYHSFNEEFTVTPPPEC